MLSIVIEYDIFVLFSLMASKNVIPLQHQNKSDMKKNLVKPEAHDAFEYTDIVYISDKLKEFYPNTYARLTKLFENEIIEWEEVKGTKDIWIRDYMPIQKSNDFFISYNYNPDYLQGYRQKYLTDSHDIIKNIPQIKEVINSNIKLDGGNVIITPYHWILTDKVFEENGMEKDDTSFISLLREIAGSDIILLPWHKEEDDKPWSDVYGHADGLVQWTGENNILMANHRDFYPEEAHEIIRRLNKAGYKVTEMLFDVANPNYELNWAYINYLKVDKKIIVPTFGIDEDKQALFYISKANPHCTIIPFRMRDIARNGGAIHCITWNIKFRINKNEQIVLPAPYELYKGCSISGSSSQTTVRNIRLSTSIFPP